MALSTVLLSPGLPGGFKAQPLCPLEGDPLCPSHPFGRPRSGFWLCALGACQDQGQTTSFLSKAPGWYPLRFAVQDRV